MKNWIRAARPKTLSASWIPVVVGTVLAFKLTANFNYVIFLCTLLSSLFIQVATNYLNDAIDFKKGADTATRLGPQRMTQGGFVDYKKMIRAGAISLALALLFGVPLVSQGGIPIVLIGLVSAVMTFAYTGGPLPLAYLGLGDLFVYIFFGIVAVSGSYFLQTLAWSGDTLIAGSQIGLLAVVLIAINNFRDREQDILVGKKTLAVRFGVNFMKAEILICALLPFLLGIFYFQKEWMKAFALPFIVLPLAFKIIISVFRVKPSTEFNRFLAQSGALHTLFGLLLALGILMS